MNNAAIDQGVGALVKVDVPADWKNAVDEGNHAVKPGCESCPSFVQNIAQPINAQAGYDLPVSTFAGYEDGTLPAGTAKFENAVLHCSFQNGYQKTVSNVTNVPSYVHMLQFVQSWQLKQKWLRLQNISIQSLHWALKTFNSVSQYPH